MTIDPLLPTAGGAPRSVSAGPRILLSCAAPMPGLRGAIPLGARDAPALDPRDVQTTGGR